MKAIIFLVTLIALVNTLALENGVKSKIKMEIKSGWQFNHLGNDNWYTATIPGCVHTDLINNKLIEDPYFGINESKLQWIGEKNWAYKTTFDVTDELLSKQNVELVFKGLDTYAEVFLNGTKILSANNMFREWKVDCKPYLKQQGNVLQINFRNVFDENIPKYNAAPYRLMAYDNNDQADVKINMYSRKAGFHFGWDWGPRFVTYGIWRPVFIEAWDKLKLNDVFVKQQNVSINKVNINSNLEILSTSNQKCEVKVFVNEQLYTEEHVELVNGINNVPVNFEIKNPKLWWTNGLGDQYLYDFKFIVSNQNCVDEKTYKIGVRSIEVVRDKDSIGTSFYFKINGVPVFAKGANYIPQDNFQNRVTPERQLHMIKSAADANFNILRVWGGGIYEDDIFYDLCDKYGILVWQEFAFACGMYPVDKEYLDNVKNEVTDNVKRLRNHTSLAMYCGNNENEIAWFEWGWKQKYSAEIQKVYEEDYKKLFYETIPNALKQVDDTRYYHPSSPNASYGNFSYNNGDAHYWSVWHGREPFEKFNDNIGRFMSEYGFQSYPDFNAIKKFTNPEDRNLHSEIMLSHQRCMQDERKDKEYGNRLIQWYMERMYQIPKDFEKYLYVAQVLQAEGIKMAIEVHRRNMPKCMGTMYWQIDDCWPVASWSSIDYYGNWKALHYFAKNAYAPILVSPYLKNDQVEFYIVSDKLQSLESALELEIKDFNGNLIYSKQIPIVISPNSSKIYFKINKTELINNYPEDKVFLDAKVLVGNEVVAKNVLYFKNPKDLKLEQADVKCKTIINGENLEIELTSNKLAKNVFLSFDNTEGFFSDNYFDLLPGEVKKVLFTPTDKSNELKEKVKILSLVDSF